MAECSGARQVPVRSLLAWVAVVSCTACIGGIDDPERFLLSTDTGGAGGTDLGGGGDSGMAMCPDVLATILGNTTDLKGCAQASCHSTAVANQGLDLESPDLVGRLSGQTARNCTNALYIDPANPPNSLIYTKTLSGPHCAGGRMPIGVNLTASESSCILAWITEQVAASPDGGVGNADAGSDGGAMDADMPETGPVDMGPPDTGMQGPPAITFEAEMMTLQAPMVTATDGQASGGTYVTQPAGDLNPDPLATDVGRATYGFSVASSGNARIFARVRASSSDNDSFWIRIDNGTWFRWNDLFIESAGNWAWDDVHDSDSDPTQPVQFSLSAGMHTLEIAYREPMAHIDRLIITQDPGFTPPPN